MSIEPGDLDLVVSDARATGALLSDLLVQPVAQMDGWIADVTGRAFHGAIIEWLAGAHPSDSATPQEQEPRAGEHLELVLWRGRIVPVPELSLQLAVAQQRSMSDRCSLIREAMSRAADSN